MSHKAYYNGKVIEEVDFSAGTFDSAGRKFTPSGGAAGSVATDAIWDAKGDLAVGTGADTASALTVGSNDKVLIAASGQSTGLIWQYPPGYEFHYKAITSPVTVASTTEASGTTIITCDATTFDGAAVMCEFFAPDVVASVNNQTVYVSLFEGGTQIGELCDFYFSSATTLAGPAIGKLRFTPTAGSHTYTITAHKTSGAGTCTVDAGAGGTGAKVAAYVRFTKV